MDGRQLRIGIPKGSLEEATVKLFAKAGWKVTSHHRNYFPEINDPELTCSLCRAQEMARYVESGLLDAGLTGKDWILENQSTVEAGMEGMPLGPILTGMIVAAISGFAAIKVMIRLVSNKRLSLFSYYTWVVGTVAVIYGVLF